MEGLIDIGKAMKAVINGGLERMLKREVCRTYDIEEEMRVVCAIGNSLIAGFHIDDSNRFAYENMVRWCNNDPEMMAIDPLTGKKVKGNTFKGIYVAGKTGTGKSVLLEVISSYSRFKQFRISAGRAGVINLCWNNVRTDSICDEFAKDGEMTIWNKYPIVGFQDFGSEPNESLYMGNRMNVMGRIIESRGDRTDLITLFSSNLPMGHDMVKERYGPRVASRLFAMCNYIEMRGADRRMG